MEITTRNLVSQSTREGRVELLIDGRPVAQLSVEEARSVSRDIQETAAVAEAEAMLVRFLLDRAEMPIGKAAEVLRQFRLYREG